MTVTSPQHVDCYQARVGKGDGTWRRSFRPADPASRDCLPGYAGPARTAGTKSKAPASEDSQALWRERVNSAPAQ